MNLNSLIPKFLWGSKEGKRKPSWVSWSMMTRLKPCDGIGFLDIELFNLALLARQARRILKEPNLQSARILKANYFPDNDFLQAELWLSPSQVWRAMLEGRDILAQGWIRRIGDGWSTLIWQHNWLPRPFSMRLITSRIPNPTQVIGDLTLAEVIGNREAVEEFFLPIDVEVIFSIRLVLVPSRIFGFGHMRRTNDLQYGLHTVC